MEKENKYMWRGLICVLTAFVITATPIRDTNYRALLDEWWIGIPIFVIYMALIGVADYALVSFWPLKEEKEKLDTKVKSLEQRIDWAGMREKENLETIEKLKDQVWEWREQFVELSKKYQALEEHAKN